MLVRVVGMMMVDCVRALVVLERVRAQVHLVVRKWSLVMHRMVVYRRRYVAVLTNNISLLN